MEGFTPGGLGADGQKMLSGFVDALTEMAAIADEKGNIQVNNSQWSQFVPRPASAIVAESIVNFTDLLKDDLIVLNATGKQELLQAFNRLQAGEISAHEGIYEYRQRNTWGWLFGKLTTLTLFSQRFFLIRLENVKAPILPDSASEIPELIYKSLLDDLPILLNICDNEMRYIWVNKIFQRQFNVLPADVIGRAVNEIPGLSKFERLQELRQACFATGLEQSEIVPLSFQGREVVLDVRYIPVLGADGKIAFVVGANRDITKQVKSQESRSAAHELLNDVLERMPVGFVATDNHFHILRANSMACNLFGHHREDLIGQHIDVLIPAEYRDRHTEYMNAFAAADQRSMLMDSRREVFGVKADGTVFPIMASVLKMSLGDFPLYCVMIVDLTQIRVAEQRLVETELNIQQMQKQEALGQLAGNIAHDFNNLMAIVLGYADMIQEKKDLPEDIGLMMAEIKKAVQRGAGLTRQILAYAKHQALEVRSMDMHTLLMENHSILQAALSAGVRLRLDLHADKRFVAIDDNQFMQVLLNLAVNARDAMPLGGNFTISTEVVRLGDAFFTDRGIAPQPGDYLFLTMKDTGHGMPPEIVSRIFDPYFSTKPRDKGTGLGLSVVYGIIKQHKGFIFCDSVPGTGSTFEILLPLCEENLAVKKTQDQEKDLQVLKEKYAQVTILVVDDEDALRNMIVTLLRAEGFIVHEASNGRNALEFIDTFPGKIDIVLSDIMMPEMNGLEMADEARLLQPEAAFIFISGYSKELLMTRQPNQNFRLLIKPFQREALFAEIHHALRARFGFAGENPAADEFFI